MTPDQFNDAIKKLDWKQSDFCRMTGVNKNTPSRWINGIVPIPQWAEHYLIMAQRIHDLADLIVPPKP